MKSGIFPKLLILSILITSIATVVLPKIVFADGKSGSAKCGNGENVTYLPVVTAEVACKNRENVYKPSEKVSKIKIYSDADLLAYQKQDGQVKCKGRDQIFNYENYKTAEDICNKEFGGVEKVIVYSTKDQEALDAKKPDPHAIPTIQNQNCDKGGGDILGFPTWYKYLPKGDDGCPEIKDVKAVWMIVVAVIEFMTKLAVMLSIALVIWGGIKLMASQGVPEGIAKSRSIIINACIGLVITIIATGIVTFIGSQFKG